MRTLTLWIGVLAIALLASPTEARAFVVENRVLAISVHAFSQEMGTFGPHDLASGQFGPGPSAILFVLVEILIDPQGPHPEQLVFKASAGGKTLADQTIRLDPLLVDKNSHFYVPFLVYGTGCQQQPIELAASFADKKFNSSLTRTVDFACGPHVGSLRGVGVSRRSRSPTTPGHPTHGEACGTPRSRVKLGDDFSRSLSCVHALTESHAAKLGQRYNHSPLPRFTSPAPAAALPLA